VSDAVFHPLRLGSRIDAARPHGYYVDLRAKADSPAWPPPWLAAPAGHSAIALAQWGLGAYERHLAGEGDAWLPAALAAGERLVSAQSDDGRWLDPRPYPHTFRVREPWPSAMGQGQGASLLVRLLLATGDDRLEQAALRALAPFEVATERGGVLAMLEGGPFFEEYPTSPGSYVLNGAVFALWGLHDVAAGLGDERAQRLFEDGLETLAANLALWDTGRWSRYDLFPHPVVNVATPGYHSLHVAQLQALQLLAPLPELARTAERWEGYARSSRNRAEALVRKVLFRLLVRKPLRRAVRPISGAAP
jgi:hypothetical protein